MQVNVQQDKSFNLNIQNIELKTKLATCYKVAQTHYGAKYPIIIKDYIKIIKKYKTKNHTDTVRALIGIIENKETAKNPMWIILFMSAAVEILNKEQTNE